MNTDAEVMNVESGTVALLNKSEIDMQIATAHRYPRSISEFRKNVANMVMLSEQIAAECIYAVPRDGKMIEGPSARFAEVIASAWGNIRAGARVVSDQGDFVTAQAVMHDLERNTAITYEVQRRIVNKSGQRFKPDMISVTANAACSIALRNAILKGIPKAFWSEMYEGARKTAMGDVKTLPTRRAEVLDALLRYGVGPEQVFEKLAIGGKEDLGQEQLVQLKFILTAIKEGDTTPEEAFASSESSVGKPRVTMPVAKPRPEAPKAEVKPAEQVDQSTGEISKPASTGPNDNAASEGERKFIINRARSNSIDMLDLLERAGMTGTPLDLAGLTKDGFQALKEALTQAA